MDIVEKAKEFYRGEILDRNLYWQLSEFVKDDQIRENLLRISKTEEKHSNFWKIFLEKRGIEVEEKMNGSFKISVMKFLSRFINPIYIISVLESGENSAIKTYFDFLSSYQLDEYESKALKKIILDEIEHETYFEKVMEKFGLNNTRDIILGMNDGLVEILGTVAGLTAVYQNNPRIIGISGIVVGIAGALSMGIGAFVSVRSQKQIDNSIEIKNRILFKVEPERSYEIFRENIKEIPEKIQNELIESLKANRVDLSGLLIKHSSENELKSGLYTGLSYLLGVFFPVLPFFFTYNSSAAFVISLISSIAVVSVVSSFVALFSGISIKKKVFEMISAASFAAFLSFIFGKIVQVLFNIQV